MFKIEDIAKDEKRAGYRELCGTPHRIGDGKGGSRIVRFYCHQDECDTCRKMKGESYKERILGSMGAGTKVITMKVSSKVSESVRKEIDKDEYLCLPQKDGTDILFIDVTNSLSDGDYLDERELDRMDWSEIARRMDGRKISGGLGRPAPKSKERPEGSYEVEDTAFLFSNHILAVDVLKEVVRLTYVVSVPTEEAMQELVTQRNDMFERMYQEQGGVIISKFHQVHHVVGLDVNNSIVNSIEEGKTKDFNIKSFSRSKEELDEIEQKLIRELSGYD